MSAPADTDWMGARLARKEDRRLVTGQGRYLADIVLPGMLHAVFVRSEYAHARINGIDASEALAMPGVLAVYTGADIKDAIKPMPQPVVRPNLPARYPTFWPLAIDKVKFHGEPVALVIARDKYIAEDAAECVYVDYADLPPILDPEQALTAASPLVHEEDGSNEIFAMTFTGGDTPRPRPTTPPPSNACSPAPTSSSSSASASIVPASRRWNPAACSATGTTPTASPPGSRRSDRTSTASRWSTSSTSRRSRCA